MTTNALSRIQDFKRKLHELPRSLAHEVAQRAAPSMTQLTSAAFEGGRSVYGDARPPGVDGKPLTLEATGTTKRLLRFVANGTVVRASLGTRYAKFLIGKYGILPNGALPAQWSQQLKQLVRDSATSLLK